jgi:ligand-binding SRPBCC domain-containing protein
MGQFILAAKFDCSPSTLRDFIGVTSNFPLITDPDLEFEIMEAPEVVTAGAEIEFSIITGGFRQVLRHRWSTVNTSRIVAEQVMGPTQSWHHEQIVREASGGCELTETITFEPPGGMLGFVVTESAILESLQRGTTIRHQLIAELLSAGQLTRDSA